MKEHPEPSDQTPETGYTETELVLAVAIGSFFSGLLGVVIGIFIVL